MFRLKDVHEAAMALSVTPGTVRTWTRRGMPHYRAPGRRSAIRVDLEEVRRWLEQQSQPATSGRGAAR